MFLLKRVIKVGMLRQEVCVLKEKIKTEELFLESILAEHMTFKEAQDKINRMLDRLNAEFEVLKKIKKEEATST